jgi:hypothetical protein
MRRAAQVTARIVAGVLVAATVVIAPALSAPAGGEAAVRAWLQHRLGAKARGDRDVGYQLGWADLTGDGRPEAFALISGRWWCGSGGCSMYVLQVRTGDVRMLGRHTITRAPIAVLDTRTNGLRDFSVASCTSRGCDRARIQFDGTKYRSNPSVAPVLRGRFREAVVIRREDKATQLLD